MTDASDHAFTGDMVAMDQGADEVYTRKCVAGATIYNSCAPNPRPILTP